MEEIKSSTSKYHRANKKLQRIGNLLSKKLKESVFDETDVRPIKSVDIDGLSIKLKKLLNLIKTDEFQQFGLEFTCRVIKCRMNDLKQEVNQI